ncbi:hypothetical protein ATZ20_11290 [Sulfolobus acidocaldarius]|nr:hypothetical protein ATZ20_11290 [Sulfolobus acidocaldarius]
MRDMLNPALDLRVIKLEINRLVNSLGFWVYLSLSLFTFVVSFSSAKVLLLFIYPLLASVLTNYYLGSDLRRRVDFNISYHYGIDIKRIFINKLLLQSALMSPIPLMSLALISSKNSGLALTTMYILIFLVQYVNNIFFPVAVTFASNPNKLEDLGIVYPLVTSFLAPELFTILLSVFYFAKRTILQIVFIISSIQIPNLFPLYIQDEASYVSAGIPNEPVLLQVLYHNLLVLVLLLTYNSILVLLSIRLLGRKEVMSR